jgi:hypothetical protein
VSDMLEVRGCSSEIVDLMEQGKSVTVVEEIRSAEIVCEQDSVDYCARRETDASTRLRLQVVIQVKENKMSGRFGRIITACPQGEVTTEPRRMLTRNSENDKGILGKSHDYVGE